jgi:hypothetical protein
VFLQIDSFGLLMKKIIPYMETALRAERQIFLRERANPVLIGLFLPL